MRRQLVVGVVVAVCLTPLAASAATVKPNSSCRKVGATSTLGTMHLRCVKVGGRLVWKKIATPKPSVLAPAPETTSILEGSLCDPEGLELFPISGPLRCTAGKWTAVPRAEDSVATRAFRALSAQYRGNAEALPGISIVTDPRLPDGTAAAVTRGMGAAARLWRLGKVPMTPYPVVIAYDSAWLGSQSARTGLDVPAFMLHALQLQESESGGCMQAFFLTHTGRPGFAFCERATIDAFEGSSGWFALVAAHEFTHLAEFALMDDVQGRLSANKLPAWFTEGLSTYVQFTFSREFGSPDDRRSLATAEVRASAVQLSDYNSGVVNADAGAYNLGFFAIEAFYALQGQGSVERLLKECGTGVRLDVALRNTTGKGFVDWTTLMQGYIDSIRAGVPWTLAELQRQAA